MKQRMNPQQGHEKRGADTEDGEKFCSSTRSAAEDWTEKHLLMRVGRAKTNQHLTCHFKNMEEVPLLSNFQVQ